MSESPTVSTPASSIVPTPGLLFVTCNVKTVDPPVPEDIIHPFYDEHLTDVLSTPGNGGLALRYANTGSNISVWDDPGFEGRYAAPEETIEKVGNFGWKWLALVKLSDVAWCTTQQFNDMPRTSSALPKAADGSNGSAFDYFHVGLRTYETIHKKDGGPGGAKWLVTVQFEDENLDAVVKAHADRSGHRGYAVYKLVEGLLPYPEPGLLPQSLAIFEFDGGKPEAENLSGKAVRTDVWEFHSARGDMNLSL